MSATIRGFSSVCLCALALAAQGCAAKDENEAAQEAAVPPSAVADTTSLSMLGGWPRPNLELVTDYAMPRGSAQREFLRVHLDIPASGKMDTLRVLLDDENKYAEACKVALEGLVTTTREGANAKRMVVAALGNPAGC